MQRLRYSRYLKSIIILLDLIVIASIFIYFFINKNMHQAEVGLIYEHFFSIALLFLFWILLSGRTKIYSIQRHLTYTLFLERLSLHFIFFTIGVLLISKVSNNGFFNSSKYWLTFSLFIAIIFVKSFIFFLLKYFRRRGINNRNVMFLTENESTEILKNTLLARKDYGYKIFDYKNSLSKEDLEVFWVKNGIHTLFVPMGSDISSQKENEIFRLAEAHKVKVSLVPTISQSHLFLYEMNYLQTQPILRQAKYPLDYYTNFLLKRSFDLVFSIFILLFIGIWLMPIIYFIIKTTSKGPVFFKQKRYGFHEEIFTCYKFRTMVENEFSTTKTTSQNDKRITPFGKFLRKTSLDEFPQFFNVLKGDMSIVGPRPHMLAVDHYYKPKIGRYALRSMVLPGITGLAQVNGLRGDFGNVEIEMNKRILADTFYVKNWSFVLDLVIVFKTVFLVIGGDKNAK